MHTATLLLIDGKLTILAPSGEGPRVVILGALLAAAEGREVVGPHLVNGQLQGYVRGVGEAGLERAKYHFEVAACWQVEVRRDETEGP